MANFINPGLMSTLADPYRGQGQRFSQHFQQGARMGMIQNQQAQEKTRQDIAGAYKMIDSASSVLSKGKKLPKETRAMYSKVLIDGHNILARHWGMNPIPPGAELDENDEPFIDELNALTNAHNKKEIEPSTFRPGYMGIIRRAEGEGDISEEGAKRLIKQIETEQAARYTGLLRGQFPQQGAARPPQQLQREFSQVAPEQFLKFQKEQQQARTKARTTGDKSVQEFRQHVNSLDSLYRNIDPITKAIIGVEDQEKQIEARTTLMKRLYPRQSKIYFANRNEKTGKVETQKKLKPITSSAYKMIMKKYNPKTEQEAIEAATKEGFDPYNYAR